MGRSPIPNARGSASALPRESHSLRGVSRYVGPTSRGTLRTLGEIPVDSLRVHCEATAMCEAEQVYFGGTVKNLSTGGTARTCTRSSRSEGASAFT